jgi:hypothetical protein
MEAVCILEVFWLKGVVPIDEVKFDKAFEISGDAIFYRFFASLLVVVCGLGICLALNPSTSAHPSSNCSG